MPAVFGFGISDEKTTFKWILCAIEFRNIKSQDKTHCTVVLSTSQKVLYILCKDSLICLQRTGILNYFASPRHASLEIARRSKTLLQNDSLPPPSQKSVSYSFRNSGRESEHIQSTQQSKCGTHRLCHDFPDCIHMWHCTALTSSPTVWWNGWKWHSELHILGQCA